MKCVKKILPSILGTKDVRKFLERIQNINQNGISNITEIHVDMMDGIFVNNKCGNLEDIITIKEKKFDADVHFMYENPDDEMIEAVNYGAESITIHYEISDFYKHFEKLKELRKKYNINIGISICPETSEQILADYIKDIDIVLVMSVHPGKGGQPFIEETYNKIKSIRKMSKAVSIIVDGGINDTNISEVFECGADKVVIGNYLTKDESMIETRLKRLKI